MHYLWTALPALIVALGIASAPYLVLEDAAPGLKWWAIMIASSVAVAGLLLGTVWRRSGLAGALLLVGVSAQLGLTYPIWFQKIELDSSSIFSYTLLLAIILQAGGTARLLLPGGGLTQLTRFAKASSIQRIVVFGVLMLGVTASAMDYIDKGDAIGYLKQLVFGGTFLMLNMLTLAALVQNLPKDAFATAANRVGQVVSLLQPEETSRPLDRWMPILAAGWVLIACGMFSVFALQRLPHVPDEVVYLLQARYFLQGDIFLALPPSLDAFGYDFIDTFNDKWFSIFPPGWPLVLAFGVFLHLPWLINPLLAAASILLAHVFFRRIATVGVANVAILLMAVSPWFIETSATLMSHTLTLFLLLTAWVLLLRASDKRPVLSAVAAGGLMGFLFLTRPLDGLIAGILTGFWCLYQLRGSGSWRVVLAYCLGCLVIGALILPYNHSLTGDYLATPINRYFDDLWAPGANRLGFGPDIGPPERWSGIDLYRGHSFKESIVNAQQNFYALNFEFMGFVLGSLWLLFIHMIWGRWKRSDFQMALFCAATVGVLSLYWFTGSFYSGPRYWFLMFLPLVALTVSGIGTLAAQVDRFGKPALPAHRLGLVMIVISAISMTSFLSWRGVTKFLEFRGFHTDYRVIMENHDLTGGLIFVKARAPSGFASAYVHNRLDFKGDSPIFARDLGPASNRAVSQAFPDRPVYFIVEKSSTAVRTNVIYQME